MSKFTYDGFLEQVKTMSAEQLNAMSLAYKLGAVINSNDETVSGMLNAISASLAYIAELKTPCQPGDADCIQHHAKNCQCLDERFINGNLRLDAQVEYGR